jgi:hypothetical protein
MVTGTVVLCSTGPPRETTKAVHSYPSSNTFLEEQPPYTVSGQWFS